MADETPPLSDERLAEIREAIDDAVLTHTGRSIGDLASERVAEDVVGTLHTWLQQQLEQHLPFPVYGPAVVPVKAAGEPMTDETPPLSEADRTQLREMLTQYHDALARKSITPAGVPVHLWIAGDIVSQAVEPLMAEVDRLRAENAAMREAIVDCPVFASLNADCPWCDEFHESYAPKDPRSSHPHAPHCPVVRFSQ